MGKKLQTALETKGFLWEDIPEVNLPMHPEAVDEVVVPDSSVAALFVEVVEEIDIHPSTSTKKAVGNKRISMSEETMKDVAVVEAAAEVVVASEEVWNITKTRKLRQAPKGLQTILLCQKTLIR